MGKKKSKLAPERPRRRYEVEMSLPDTDLSANKSVNRYARNDAFQAYKRAADLQFRMAEIPRLDGPDALRLPITVGAQFFCYKKHPFAKRFYMPRDDDNARRSLKAVIDALKSARIVPDDSIKYVKGGEIEIFSKAAEHNNRMGLTFIIEEAP